MGNIILSRESALEFWRLVSCGEAGYWLSDIERCRGSKTILKNAERLTASSAQGAMDKHLILRRMKRPLHIGINNTQSGICNKQVHARTISGKIGQYAFCKIEDGLYVCSPELLFVQLQEKGLIEALLIGHELCGTYTDPSVGCASDEQTLPVTSAERIRTYLSHSLNCRHLNDARAAAQYLKDNSRSLLESKLSIEYGLPLRWGGRGFPDFELNHVTPLPLQLQDIHGTPELTSDMYWPQAAVGCEFTDEHWSMTSKLTEESFRAALQENCGISVYPMRKECLNDFFAAEEFADSLIKRLGAHKGQGASERQIAKRISLRRELYGTAGAPCPLDDFDCQFEQEQLEEPELYDWY